MAGWSMIAGGSTLDCAKTPKKLESTGLVVDLQSVLEFKPNELPNPSSEGLIGKLRCWFDQCLGVFLKEICAKDTFRPLPPMLGDGQCVDLFKLFSVVREKGGCNAVSEKKLWDSVAEESGLGLSFTAAVKLVYIKYLDTLERWLGRVALKDPKSSLSSSGSDLDEYLMELQAGFKRFMSEIADGKANDGGLYPHLPSDLNLQDVDELKTVVVDSDGCRNCDVGGKNLNSDFGKKNGDVGKLCVGDVKCLEGETGKSKKCVDGNEGFPCSDIKKLRGVHDIKSVVDLDGWKSCDDDDGGDEDLMILDPETIDKENFGNKRKRESLWGMLDWVTMVAKDPCDPAIGLLPDKSKWKSYSDTEIWKQVLMAREAIFSKRNIDSGGEQSYLQKIQRMHPSMYDDQLGSGYNLRERLRCGKKLLYGKMASHGGANAESSDLDRSPSPGSAGLEDHFDKQLGATESSMPLKVVPLGSNFQVEVPAWTGETSESESKWLGVRLWPLEKSEHRFLIERDPIGKGRQDSCGCQMPGSTECVRFHVAEKRLRLKMELGSAFYQWRFDKMGEDVALYWTKEDQKKFKAIVSSNPPSIEISFWNKIFKSFPTKSREDLVSYYFNVFVLRRRGYQNRFTPTYIDSDNDEFESMLVANGFGHETHDSANNNLLHENKQHESKR
ncbi:hypothetical protein FEM48_Zijuj12G0160600 [Ziziphus jujuba var. spinosa]|uniref:ARID domain-containing protein n=1 Tax=Ziziphus jujuba var. spinosa TaxID=714518 RepID=A0A978UEA7_ZIZJJ|nr:hypothetical protein FEM48_Zijuj12G0160600 [Ziziphus jujuba var. spinosa]